MKENHCPICGPGTPFVVRYPERFNREALQFTARKTPDHMHFRVVRCTVCGLIYSNPIPDVDEIVGLYRDSEFIEEPQLENMVADYLAEFERVRKLCEVHAVLEVGCSSGFFLRRVKALGIEEVCGVEPSRAAADNAPSDLRPNIAQDVLREGLFPKEHFDVVCFFQVFDHIVEPNAFLDLVHHYLKPGGILLAIHHNIRALYPTVFGRWASTYDISHIHLWDKHTMRLILEKHDFTVVAIDNLPTRYYFDHIVRMLPLPEFLRRAGRTLLKSTGLGRASIKVSVENMVTIARK